MGTSTKKSSPGPRRRLPLPSFGIDINFCRNPQCALFAEAPDPYDMRGKTAGKVKPNLPRGRVIGSGDEKTFKCGCCGKSSIIKNNRAIVEEYRRLRAKFRPEFPRDACSNAECRSYGKPLSQAPELYRKSGTTTKGTQRWKCKSCLKTFATGTRLGRQKRSHTNREILWMLTNGVPITKICDFTELSPRDVYRKIDFIHDRVIDFTAKREANFQRVSWETVGRRFATDSQTLHLNWPNKKTRAQIAVHHLCTAHANTGYIMAAHLQLDPSIDLPDIEARMMASGDFNLPRAYRQQARLWSGTEFKAYLDKMTRNVEIHPSEAPDVDLGLQLPHRGALVRQDAMQMAHAFLLRKFLRKGDERFVFVLDADSGLAMSFVSAFARWIRDARADVIVVEFDKNKSNDQRNMLMNDGRQQLEGDSSIPRQIWDDIHPKIKDEIKDLLIEEFLENRPITLPFEWPYHTKSEPHRRMRILTDRSSMDLDRRARLMRLATLRSVDAYFHKVRSNLKFAERPSHTPSANGRAWHRHYLYNPETMVKVVDIYRFTHNWMGSRTTKETPAMKLGLARGKVNAKDLFS